MTLLVHAAYTVVYVPDISQEQRADALVVK